MIDATVLEHYRSMAIEHGLHDFTLDDRPWGGEFLFDDAVLEKFTAAFFPQLKVKTDQLSNPKFLLVAPHQRFSWQYHNRRAEMWRVLGGPAGVITSLTDEQPPVRILQVGETVEFAPRQRHRFVGLEGWGVVAELWQHEDLDHPSNEDDNVRLEDDYGRA